MQRAADIEEVCMAVIHLTSKHSRRITGQVINVDGGKNLTIRG
jgi:enoyl-[acyl-carrier-protein] reductase (NADH)